MIVNAIPDVLAPRKMQLIFQRHSSSYLEPMKQRWKVITGIIAGFAVVFADYLDVTRWQIYSFRG